ncbi:MAG: hypothetical protein CTY20_04430 [Hyphomicrobium sp.]|nr:MAG: hypothetical protein CTY20_04430 [Hyphomicrobium sp.]
MFWTNGLPPEVIAAIEAETAGETVRWAGKPDADRAFRAGFAIYAMAVPWCALIFTVFGVLVLAVTSGKTPSRPIPWWEYWAMGAALIFTASFVAVGIGMLLTPFWIRWKALRSVYAITDKRILTIVTGHTMEVSAISGDKILKLERKEKRDGSGTLRIVTGYGKDSDGDRVEEATELYAVPNVRAAERALDAIRTPRPV